MRDFNYARAREMQPIRRVYHLHICELQLRACARDATYLFSAVKVKPYFNYARAREMQLCVYSRRAFHTRNTMRMS